jgi:protein-disulfide isomerase
LPLWELRGHQFSGTAAALSEIAAEHGRFWAFMDLIHQQHTQLDAAGYLELMRTLRLPTTDIEERLNSDRDPAIDHVRRDMALADQLGLDATPAFILFVAGQQPISANPRTLPSLLNSSVVRAKMGTVPVPFPDGSAIGL